MAKPDRLFLAVQDILFYEWDPIGVGDNALNRDEYNSYARTICRWLREGVDEYKLTKHLSQLRRVSMGLSKSDEESDRRVAWRLLDAASSRSKNFAS